MGDLRDKVDVAAFSRDADRAAHAGGPKHIARLGRPRGADRFPVKHRGKRKR
jgi:hypothetical protein